MVYFQIGMTILLQCIALLYLKVSKQKEQSKVTVKECFILLFSVILTCFVGIMARKKTENIAEFTKVITLYQVLFCAAVIDAKKKIIPNLLIGFGACMRFICYVVEIFWLKLEWREQLISDCFGILAGAGILLLAYLFSKKSVGLGDVKLFGVIGCYMGFSSTYTILFLSILCSAFAAIYLVCIRKKKRDYSIAFAPFVLVGYIITVVCM